MHVREWILVATLAACSGLPLARRSPLPQQNLPLRVRSAPLAVTLAHYRVTLAADAWLNFQPGSFDSESHSRVPMNVYVRLTSTDSRPIPPNIMVDSVYATRGDSSFSWGDLLKAPARDGQPVTGEYQTFGGPRWALSADSVDVAVRVKDTRTGITVILRAPRVRLASVS